MQGKLSFTIESFFVQCRTVECSSLIFLMENELQRKTQKSKKFRRNSEKNEKKDGILQPDGQSMAKDERNMTDQSRMMKIIIDLKFTQADEWISGDGKVALTFESKKNYSVYVLWGNRCQIFQQLFYVLQYPPSDALRKKNREKNKNTTVRFIN